ncbi:UPF0598 protein CG30010 isoform X2 [Malaya genurostris]|uniref:UPF0598 protein CG30010 isoform X2 n=1 Tax=Malaya genurostris TaxID=325434 RepID=UPI0026F381FF|nr:UPF0598 protein CG30010 isoform X2 [Malaya genurostris]
MILKSIQVATVSARKCSSFMYRQGQSPAPNVREYFYYIDHEGMRLRFNEGTRYREHFPFLSPCGRERNYVRCDDVPIVFTHIFQDSKGIDQLSFAHAGDLLTVPWEPDRICMFPLSGRVYHPAPERCGSIGLVRSKLAIELSKHFTFLEGEDEPPTHFAWKNTTYELNREWWKSTYISGRIDKVE